VSSRQGIFPVIVDEYFNQSNIIHITWSQNNLSVTVIAYIFAFVATLQLQELDTEIVVATTSGTARNTTAVAANIVFDERQMNALFLDVVSYFRLT